MREYYPVHHPGFNAVTTETKNLDRSLHGVAAEYTILQGSLYSNNFNQTIVS